MSGGEDKRRKKRGGAEEERISAGKEIKKNILRVDRMIEERRKEEMSVCDRK